MFDQARITGALLGLAVGDALGTTNEFQHKPEPISDMVGGGPFNLPAGDWTDDTSMALCLADSLITCQGFDAKDQMERYVRWWKTGYNSPSGRCFDIGNTCLAALRRFLDTGNPLAGDTDPGTAGNGSLMRLVPVVIWYADIEEQAVEMAGMSSRTTHGAPQAVRCCQDYARLICRALRGESKQAILAGCSIQAASGITPSGYVVESLDAALHCFATTDSFQAGCLRAANLGGDADTIAAIYGQLAGAYYREDGIPDAWRAKLRWASEIRTRALQLAPPH